MAMGSSRVAIFRTPMWTCDKGRALGPEGPAGGEVGDAGAEVAEGGGDCAADPPPLHEEAATASTTRSRWTRGAIAPIVAGATRKRSTSVEGRGHQPAAQEGG